MSKDRGFTATFGKYICMMEAGTDDFRARFFCAHAGCRIPPF